MSTNVTLVNSDWTGEKFAEVYGGPTRTLYPPVLGNSCPTPWHQRQAAFVCLGRIAPEKEIPKIVAILADVRARTGKPIELHIVGSAYDKRHARKITDLVSRHSGWVRLHTDVSQDEKARLVANCRYGIHGMVREHFGIAPAEIQRAGSIVFVPVDGGAAEIVAHDRRLMYRSPEDAVDKICRVLDDEKLERELVELAAGRHEVFTEQRFVREFRAIVHEVETLDSTSE
jgi:glycosyltransferase involved in cell wall biosynthesis